MTRQEFIDGLKLSRAPWAHQVDEWLASEEMNERLLLWEMGTGKTTTSVVWLRLKYRRINKVAKTLILAPLSTLGGWLREFKLNAPESVAARVAIASGTGKKKMTGEKRAQVILNPEKEIIITNHDSLNVMPALSAMQRKGFEAIVVDEIHRFKNPQSKRFRNLLTFSDRATFRLGLTGTFILNSYMDIWAPIRFADKGKRFGTNFFSQFRNKYFVDINAGWRGANAFPNWQPRPELNDAVAEKLSTLASRKKKEECLTLPPRIITEIEVPLSAEQERLYKQMEEDLIAYATSGEATASNALVKLLRMRQILSGFITVQNLEDPGQNQVTIIDDNPRLDALEDLLEDIVPGDKIVVWSNFKATYGQIHKIAEKLGVGYATLTGDTKDRQGEIDRFINDPMCRIMQANPQAGGTGTDGFQHVARYYVYYDRSHSLEHYLQSRDRIHRGGAEVHDKITEMHLVAENTLDRGILSALVRKENFAENVLDRLRSMYGRQAMEGKGGRGR